MTMYTHILVIGPKDLILFLIVNYFGFSLCAPFASILCSSRHANRIKIVNIVVQDKKVDKKLIVHLANECMLPVYATCNLISLNFVPEFVDDVILAITNSGTIKMWSINIHMVNVSIVFINRLRVPAVVCGALVALSTSQHNSLCWRRG